MLIPGVRNLGDLKAQSLLIFDGDDTLWKTQELYDGAKLRFAALLAQEGFANPDMIAILDRIDGEAVEIRGFSVSRFIDSMLTTYRMLTKTAHRQPDGQIENKIRRLSKPLLGEYQLYPDALPVLERLASRFRLVLATKGQPDLQGQKVTRLGLARFFHRIYILERKTDKEYDAILADYQMPPDRAWAVGNSVRSDINPALQLGIRAILVKRPAWAYEEAMLRSGDVTVVDSLSAACDAILRNESRVAARAFR
jgi:putative hydrolase of the HAD superfamily